MDSKRGKLRAHVLIKGRVQGVFFRAETCRQTRRLGIVGWVRNRWDSRVEAVFEGEEKAVQRMVIWCYKGPPDAIVEDVEIKWEDFEGEFTGFSICH